MRSLGPRLLVVIATGIALVLTIAGCSAPQPVPTKTPSLQTQAAPLTHWLRQQKIVKSASAGQRDETLEISVVVDATASDAGVRTLVADAQSRVGKKGIWANADLDLTVGKVLWSQPISEPPASYASAFQWLRNDPRVIDGHVNVNDAEGTVEDSDVVAASLALHDAVTGTNTSFSTRIVNPSGEWSIFTNPREAYPTQLVDLASQTMSEVPGSALSVTSSSSVNPPLHVVMSVDGSSIDAAGASNLLQSRFGALVPASGLTLDWNGIAGAATAFTADDGALVAGAAAIPGVSGNLLSKPLTLTLTFSTGEGWAAGKGFLASNPGVAGSVVWRTSHFPVQGDLPVDDPRVALAEALSGQAGVIGLDLGSGTGSTEGTFTVTVTTKVTKAEQDAIVAALIAHPASTEVLVKGKAPDQTSFFDIEILDGHAKFHTISTVDGRAVPALVPVVTRFAQAYNSAAAAR